MKRMANQFERNRRVYGFCFLLERYIQFVPCLAKEMQWFYGLCWWLNVFLKHESWDMIMLNGKVASSNRSGVPFLTVSVNFTAQ